MHRSTCFVAFVIAAALCAGSAIAQQRPTTIGGPMKHLDITFDGTALGVHVDDTVPIPILTPMNLGSAPYDPPFDVLNGTAHNAQYGWNPGGFITLPADAGIWVRLIEQSPELMTFEGGMMRDPASMSMNPIFTTDGSSDIWNWSGMMTHNWYAVNLADAAPGRTFHASYRVYIGDAAGQPLAGYNPADVTITFSAVPEPASLLALLPLGALALRRRR